MLASQLHNTHPSFTTWEDDFFRRIQIWYQNLPSTKASCQAGVKFHIRFQTLGKISSHTNAGKKKKRTKVVFSRASIRLFKLKL